MLVYIIDGYNLAHSVPSLKNSPSVQRDLINYIKLNQLSGSRRNKVIVFFDGNRDLSLAKESEYEVFYSGDKTADELIINKIRNLGRKIQMILVTDDRELRDRAKQEGAGLLRVCEFVKVKEKKTSDSKSISFALQKEITDEMRKYWLKS